MGSNWGQIKIKAPKGKAMKCSIMLLTCFIACASCSNKELYNASRGWQQNECQKIVENEDRARCMEAATKSFEQYKKEQETVKKQ
jgi:hypothetical protein